MVYVPYEELIVKRWNQSLFILHSEKATGYPIKRVKGMFVSNGENFEVVLLKLFPELFSLVYPDVTARCIMVFAR